MERNYAKDIEVIKFVLEDERLNDYGKFFAIKSYLGGWLTAEDVTDGRITENS